MAYFRASNDIRFFLTLSCFLYPFLLQIKPIDSHASIRIYIDWAACEKVGGGIVSENGKW